jgi:hypothetical protein
VNTGERALIENQTTNFLCAVDLLLTGRVNSALCKLRHEPHYVHRCTTSSLLVASGIGTALGAIGVTKASALFVSTGHVGHHAPKCDVLPAER